MKKRIDSKKYKNLLNSLRDEAKNTNTKVIIRYREPSADEEHSVNGGFNFNDNVIKISVYGRQPRIYILAVLAHEVRHAQHLANGQYSDYYNYDRFFNSKFFKELKTNPFSVKLPNLRTGLNAEKNCNDFSIQWLLQHGIDVLDYPFIYFLTEPYKLEGLANFDFYDLIKKQRKNFKFRSV